MYEGLNASGGLRTFVYTVLNALQKTVWFEKIYLPVVVHLLSLIRICPVASLYVRLLQNSLLYNHHPIPQIIHHHQYHTNIKDSLINIRNQYQWKIIKTNAGKSWSCSLRWPSQTNILDLIILHTMSWRVNLGRKGGPSYAHPADVFSSNCGMIISISRCLIGSMVARPQA